MVVPLTILFNIGYGPTRVRSQTSCFWLFLEIVFCYLTKKKIHSGTGNMETRLNSVPLNGENYVTWKIQCKMALIKDGLWSILNETESFPTEANAY